MKNPSEMSNNQLVSWLNKTVISADNHLDRCCNNPMNDKGLSLIDRYNDLKDESLKRSELWDDFCIKNNYDFDHNGYDLFA